MPPQDTKAPTLPKLLMLSKLSAMRFKLRQGGCGFLPTNVKPNMDMDMTMTRSVKSVIACAILCGGFVSIASSVKAVEPASLSQYGLSGLAEMSNAEGSKIRGTGGSAATAGSSFISGMLIDGATKSYVFGVDTNRGMATLQQAGIVGPVDPFHVQSSNLGLGMEIENLFRGTLMGGAGGTATSLFR